MNEEKQQADLIRRIQAAIVNGDTRTRKELEAEYGQTWTTEEMTADFTVSMFAAPYVIVTRLSDGVRGSLLFRHHPRVYFGWRGEA